PRTTSSARPTSVQREPPSIARQRVRSASPLPWPDARARSASLPCPLADSCHDDGMYDVVIVGAGPAGLSAALMLGRCRRTVLVCDTGKPRNAASRAMHGFLTRDGIPPREFLGIAREQLRRYDTIELRNTEVVDARCVESRFQVTLAGGERFVSRKLLIAT